jgi:AraC-like ligand binding domain
MPLSFIDTNRLSKQPSTGHGEVVDVLSEALCGAQNVHGSLRLLKSAEAFTPEASDRHQLIYLMDGKGCIRLDNRDFEVERGAGVYLGPRETATISVSNGASLRLFHLIVPQIPR